MGRARTGIVLAIVAVLFALVAAPGASARHVQVHVNIKDQNGYRMSIEASRSARRVIQVASSKVEGPNASAPVRALSRRQAAEAAQRSKVSDAKPRTTSGFISVQVENHHAISTYGVQGTVTHNRLFGRLGDFGRISLHFHLRHTRTEHHGCIRDHERLGNFRGRVHFRGEKDYVNVKARELHGKVEMSGRLSHRCGIALPSPGRPRQKADSTAKPGSRDRHAHRYTVFYAQKHSTSGSTFFAAVKETREDTDFLTYSFKSHGPVLVEREQYADGKAGDFRVAKGANAARIEPSARAFRGAGHFRARHKQNHWKGSLVTSMPGAPDLRLAGKNFKALLHQSNPFHRSTSTETGSARR
jgi:hypothetical protein